MFASLALISKLLSWAVFSFYFSFGPWTSHRLSSVDDLRGKKRKKKKTLNKSLKAECFKIEERTPLHIFFHRRVHPTAWLKVEKDQKSFCNFTDEKRRLSLGTYSYFWWLKKRGKLIKPMLWNDKREGNKKRDSGQSKQISLNAGERAACYLKLSQ